MFSNEFGNTFSPWSAKINTSIQTDNKPIILDVNGTKSVFIFSSLNVTCISPTLAHLTWIPYTLNELLKYIESLIEFDYSLEKAQIIKSSIDINNIKSLTSRELIIDVNRTCMYK